MENDYSGPLNDAQQFNKNLEQMKSKYMSLLDNVNDSMRDEIRKMIQGSQNGREINEYKLKALTVIDIIMLEMNSLR